MAYLSRRDIEDLKPSIEKAVYKTLGNSDSSVLRVAIDGLTNGYDRRRIADKLDSYVDSKKASRLAERIQNLVDDLESSRKSKKRSYDDDRDRDRDSKKSKSDSNRDRDRDREKDRDSMDRREKHLSDKDGVIRNLKMDPLPPPSKNNISLANIKIPQPSIYGIPSGLLNKGDAEKARKIAQLQVRKLIILILTNTLIFLYFFRLRLKVSYPPAYWPTPFKFPLFPISPNLSFWMRREGPSINQVKPFNLLM